MIKNGAATVYPGPATTSHGLRRVGVRAEELRAGHCAIIGCSKSRGYTPFHGRGISIQKLKVRYTLFLFKN